MLTAGQTTTHSSLTDIFKPLRSYPFIKFRANKLELWYIPKRNPYLVEKCVVCCILCACTINNFLGHIINDAQYT